MEDLEKQPIIDEKNQQGEADLGTFKSVKNLKDAYDSLRKVFTQKSMELAQLKKETEGIEVKDSKTNEKELVNEAKDTKNDVKTNEKVLKNEKSKSDKVNQTPDNNADKENSPVKFWENEKWNEEVKNFFDKNSKARNYITEIGQVLIREKDLEFSKDPLNSAWIKVLEKKIDDNALNSNDLEEVVMKNENLKQKIIQEYLNQLNNKKVAPLVIEKNQGAIVGAEVKKHAFSIQEAKEMAKKILIN